MKKLNMNMISKLLTIFLLVIGFIQSAQASGGMSTGGGPSVICRGPDHQIQVAEFYDLFEGIVRYGRAIQYSTSSPREQILSAIDRFGSTDFFRALLTEVLKEVLDRFQFLPSGVVLMPGNDLGNEVGIRVFTIIDGTLITVFDGARAT